MILETLVLIETLFAEHVNEIVGITVFCVAINFAVNGGFKLFKKPPKKIDCPHLKEDD